MNALRAIAFAILVLSLFLCLSVVFGDIEYRASAIDGISSGVSVEAITILAAWFLGTNFVPILGLGVSAATFRKKEKRGALLLVIPFVIIITSQTVYLASRPSYKAHQQEFLRAFSEKISDQVISDVYAEERAKEAEAIRMGLEEELQKKETNQPVETTPARAAP